MASNKHAQIRYKVLDDCFSNYRRKFYFDDLMDRCNDALRELYGEEHTGIKTRTLRSDINYIRTRAAEAGVEVEVKDDGNGYYYRYSEPDFSIFKRGLGEDDLAQLKETILMLQRFKGMPNFDWMSELVVKLEDKLDLRGFSKSVVGYDEIKSYTGLDWFQELVPQGLDYRVNISPADPSKYYDGSSPTYSQKVKRGGNYGYGYTYCRSASRNKDSADTQYFNIGCRVVCPFEQE